MVTDKLRQLLVFGFASLFLVKIPNYGHHIPGEVPTSMVCVATGECKGQIDFLKEA